MKKLNIYLDMDGTIADLYNYPQWLHLLQQEKIEPYEFCSPIVNMAELSAILKLNNVNVNILSWLSKNGSSTYNRKVRYAKLRWLEKNGLNTHIVKKYIIVPYGTNKGAYARNEYDVLFDDELNNRRNWISSGGIAYSPKNMLEKLKFLIDIAKL